MVLANPGEAVSDRPGDCASGTFGRGPSASIAPPESDSTSQLPYETFTFGIRLRSPFNVPHGPRFFDVLFDLCEPAAIRLFGALIEQLAGISRISNQTGSSGVAGHVGPSSPCGHEVQDVELSSRLGEEERQVLQALRIAQACGPSFEPDRPVVTLAAKDGGIGEMHASWWMQRSRPGERKIAAGLRRASFLIRCAYSLERCAGGSELEQGALLLSLCAQRMAEAHTCESCLIRGANIAPLLCRGLEVSDGASRVAVCQAHPCVSKGRAGAKRLALKQRGNLPELLGSRPGLNEIAGRDLDLHLRLEKRCATQFRVRRPLLRRNG